MVLLGLILALALLRKVHMLGTNKMWVSKPSLHMDLLIVWDLFSCSSIRFLEDGRVLWLTKLINLAWVDVISFMHACLHLFLQNSIWLHHEDIARFLSKLPNILEIKENPCMLPRRISSLSFLFASTNNQWRHHQSKFQEFVNAKYFTFFRSN